MVKFKVSKSVMRFTSFLQFPRAECLYLRSRCWRGRNERMNSISQNSFYSFLVKRLWYLLWLTKIWMRVSYLLFLCLKIKRTKVEMAGTYCKTKPLKNENGLKIIKEKYMRIPYVPRCKINWFNLDNSIYLLLCFGHHHHHHHHWHPTIDDEEWWKL